MYNLTFNNNHDFILLFEKKLSEFTGAPFVVLTDSCTSSIFLSLLLSEEQKIIIPKKTYISVVQAALNAKKTVFFTDEHWFKSYNLKGTNIFDCAVGFEKNMYKPGVIQCLSFQQKKCLNIGKAGAILLDDEYKYNKLKRLIWDGRDSSKPLNLDTNVMLNAFHCYMTPDDAAKGVLLLNQINEERIYAGFKCSDDYDDLSKLYKDIKNV